MSWTVDSTEGDKRNKQWFTDNRGTEPTDEQWAELFEVYKKASPTDKKTLLNDYDIGLQTLQKKAGHEPSKREGSNGARSRAVAKSQAMTPEELKTSLREHIDELKAELASAEKQLELVDKIDDEMLAVMKRLSGM